MSADAAPPAVASRSMGWVSPCASASRSASRRISSAAFSKMSAPSIAPGYAMIGANHADTRRTRAFRAASLVQRPGERTCRSLGSVDPDDDPLLRHRLACTRIVMDHRDRATRLLQHVLAHRADAQTEEAAAAARSDHEQVGFPRYLTRARHGRSQTEMRSMVLAARGPPPTTTHSSSTASASSSEYVGSNSSARQMAELGSGSPMRPLPSRGGSGAHPRAPPSAAAAAAPADPSVPT